MLSYTRERSEQVLYDAIGEPHHYLTGASVLFNLSNTPVGSRQGLGLVNRQGQVKAWFDGAFAWDAAGVLAFAEGAAPGALAAENRAAPLLRTTAPPPLTWCASNFSFSLIGHLAVVV